MDETAPHDWTIRLLEDSASIRALLERMQRIAVLGIKPESHADAPAHFVPQYAQAAGVEVVPVPVYYPEVTTILGQPVYRRVADVPGDLDLVNVFRRSADVPAHVDDILAKRPYAVWMQSGIRNAEAAERLARAGVYVVQDRCLMVEMQRVGR